MFGSLPFGSESQSQASLNVSSDAGVKKARQEVKEQVLPVTIRSIEVALAGPRAADNAELQFFGCAQPASVIVVAVVETLVRQTASIEMVLNDGTGRIKARYFPADMARAKLDLITVGSYVNVVGGVRSAPEVHLGLLCARPISSADEVSYHLIECAHACLKLQRGSAADSQPVVATPSKLRQVDASLDVNMTPLKQDMPATATEAPAQQAAPLRSVVADVLQREAPGKGDLGLSISELAALVGQTRGKPPADAELRAVLDAMVNDADVFNTIDDDHFAPL